MNSSPDDSHLRTLAQVGEIALGLAHDLGNVLNQIGMRSHLIKRQVPEAVRPGVEQIVQAVRQGAELLQMLRSVRLGAPEANGIRLNEIIRTALPPERVGDLAAKADVPLRASRALVLRMLDYFREIPAIERVSTAAEEYGVVLRLNVRPARLLPADPMAATIKEALSGVDGSRLMMIRGLISAIGLSVRVIAPDESRPEYLVDLVFEALDVAPAA